MKKILSFALIILTTLMLVSCSALTIDKLEENLEKRDFEVTIETKEITLKYQLLDIEEQFEVEFEGDIITYLYAKGVFSDSSGDYDTEIEAYEFDTEEDAELLYDLLVEEYGDKKYVKLEGTLVVHSGNYRALKFVA